MVGQKMIKMDELAACFAAMPGIQNVSTYTQSGNVLFDSTETDELKLRTDIEHMLENCLGYKVQAILRVFGDLKKVVTNNPFDTIKTEDKPKLYVTFLTDIPPYDLRGSLGVYSNDAEYARVVHREVYIYSGNYGKTCFSNSFIEKKLGLTATTRNWATVNKILEL